MPLTPAQRTTLAADIALDGGLSTQPLTPEGHKVIADAYNAPASPSFTVWRPLTPVSDMTAVFVWTEIDVLTVGKARIWDWLSRSDLIETGKANVRQGLNDAFSLAVNTRAACIAAAKRFATRGERLFATGVGSDASPGALVFEGLLTIDDIAATRVPVTGGGWTVTVSPGVFSNGATTFTITYDDGAGNVVVEQQKVTGAPPANWVPTTAGVRIRQLKILKTYAAAQAGGTVTPSDS